MIKMAKQNYPPTADDHEEMSQILQGKNSVHQNVEEMLE